GPFTVRDTTGGRSPDHLILVGPSGPFEHYNDAPYNTRLVVGTTARRRTAVNNPYTPRRISRRASRKQAEWDGSAPLTAFSGDLNALRDAVKSAGSVEEAISATRALWSLDSMDREVAFKFI